MEELTARSLVGCIEAVAEKNIYIYRYTPPYILQASHLFYQLHKIYFIACIIGETINGLHRFMSPEFLYEILRASNKY